MDQLVDCMEDQQAFARQCWKVIEECFERAGGLHETEVARHMPKSPLTIGGRRPRDARMSPRLRPLERAIAEDVSVTLAYALEDGAPVPIDVHPRFLYQRHGKSYLEAECLSSSLLKTYLLERIRKVLPAE